ncbi:MAG: hypothetical protein K9J27_00375 [Bacteroidales bacterium]|nr:hypothetical protein [Bacteroidales bacterium]MCF8332768.1 hypothetical protein [Bacteroidales bacterium]
MKRIKKSALLISFVALIVAISSCGPGKKIKDYDCPCWSNNTEVKENTIDAEKSRS